MFCLKNRCKCELEIYHIFYGNNVYCKAKKHSCICCKFPECCKSIKHYCICYNNPHKCKINKHPTS